MGAWSTYVQSLRSRHGLSQKQLGDLLGVAQRTVSRWERDVDAPGIALQKQLRDMGYEPPSAMIATLATAVRHSPVPRALSRMPSVTLVALSPPALAKRPEMADWIGADLCRIATGVLASMLDDRAFQRALGRGEIAAVVANSRGVLRAGSELPETYSTTISYFRCDGALYSDAVSGVITGPAEPGYRVISMDEALSDAAGTHRTPLDAGKARWQRRD